MKSRLGLWVKNVCRKYPRDIFQKWERTDGWGNGWVQAPLSSALWAHRQPSHVQHVLSACCILDTYGIKPDGATCHPWEQPLVKASPVCVWGGGAPGFSPSALLLPPPSSQPEIWVAEKKHNAKPSWSENQPEFSSWPRNDSPFVSQRSRLVWRPSFLEPRRHWWWGDYRHPPPR